MRPLLLQNMGHSCPHMWPIAALVHGPFLPVYMAYCSAHAWAITTLVQIRYKAWRFLTAFRIVLIFVPLNGAYMRAYMAIYGGIHGPHGSSNEACMRAYMAIYGGSNGACMRAYMAIYGGTHGPHGSINGAFMRAYMAIYGGIHGAHGSSNGACMRAYMGHIWGQPYRDGREEGNSRESPRACPFPALPLPPGKGREGKVIPTLFRSVIYIITGVVVTLGYSIRLL